MKPEYPKVVSKGVDPISVAAVAFIGLAAIATITRLHRMTCQWTINGRRVCGMNGRNMVVAETAQTRHEARNAVKPVLSDFGSMGATL